MKRVVLNEGLERLSDHGSKCGIFQRSGIEELMLPSTLREISELTFSECTNLKIVWIEQGSPIDV